MNFLLITCVTVVSPFRLFYRQLHDQMQVNFNPKQFRDIQYTSASDSNTGNVIQNSMKTSNMDSNNLSELRSENLFHLSMLIDDMMHNNSPKAKQTQPLVINAMENVSVRSKIALITPNDVPKTMLKLPSKNHRGLDKFRNRLFARNCQKLIFRIYCKKYQAMEL